MRQTFIFSNAVPQVQNEFNGAIWQNLEKLVQDLAKERREIFVITGPIPMRADGAQIVVEADRNGCGRRLVLAGRSKLGKTATCDANDDD